MWEKLAMYRLCHLSGACRGLRRLPDLVRHPLTEIAVFGLGLARVDKRDAGSAVGNAVAIENRQVDQRIVKKHG